MSVEFVTRQSATSSLQRRWLLFFAEGFAFVLAGFLLLRAIWLAEHALRWLVLTAVIVAYQIWLLKKNLPYNHRVGDQTLLPVLGLGNTFTLFRGVLFAGLTGFLFVPRPPGGLAWIPAVLYTVGALIDFVDGYAARVTNQVTKLGEILDMSFDGWGILVASILAVSYAQVPGWYILVGLARYLYLFGLWLWNRLGKKTYDLPPSKARRPFAGLQMGFAFVMLWPVFSPPGTHIAATIFSLPFLLGFIWDWFVVSGTVSPGSLGAWRRIKHFSTHWLPVVLRAGVVVLMAWHYRVYGSGLDRFFYNTSGGQITVSFISGLVILAFDILVPIFFLLGAAGRVMAILGMVMVGFHQFFTALTPVQLGLIWLYGLLLYLGTGALSIWRPEDCLIDRRAGE